jgi:AcrR family transcriptional regulator
MSPNTAAPDTRQVARDAVRSHVAAVAVGLFASEGFDEVTVEQIAAAAGISPRSFHRYFAAKEDTVIGDIDRWTSAVAEGFAARPHDEPVWDSLLAAFESIVTVEGSTLRDRQTVLVAASTSTLRARRVEKHLKWAQALAPLVIERLEGRDRDLRGQSLVHAALGCFDAGIAAWARDDDSGPNAARCLRAAFSALRQLA